MTRTSTILLGLLFAVSSFGAGPASKSATINATGPRSGASGGAYLNAEGTGTGQYASFGVADFGTISGKKGQKLKLSLSQSNAKFTKDGPIKFYISDGTAAFSTLKFNAKAANTFGAESMHPVLLGAGDFKAGAGQKVDTFTFPITADVAKILKSSKNVRIILEPAGPTVAATYAGAEHKSLKHPQLDVVP